MAGIDFNSFLGSNNTNASTINFGINLGDYAAIQNGTYYKLAKSNYAKQAAEEKSEKVIDSKLSLSSMKSSGDALKAAADKLSDRSLWQKKTIKSKDETTGEIVEKEDYDRAAINNAIKEYVKAYNDMIENAGNAETKSVLRTATTMIGDTASVSKLLDRVGIEIGSDNKLTINEDKLKEASMGELKTLFEGYGSYADKISGRASSISRTAKEATDNYTGEGTYAKKASGSSSTSSTTSGKATYQLTADMQKAILEQVQLDFYMYGGNNKSDSSTFTKKMNKFLESVDSDKKDDAKASIKKFRDELSDLVVKAIKAEDSSFKLGNTVDPTILNKIFAKDDELLQKAAAQAYGNSFNYSI
ncbi:MAG: hypothetical protein K2G45_09435 [Lachnospiraceae bacterium]|nr:hypothetical protein [Lachnospiraceae bacterium]